MKYLSGILLLAALLYSNTTQAQLFGLNQDKDKDKKEKRKFYQSSRGPLFGYERGRHDFIQLGYGYNWKKIRLKEPVIKGLDGFAEYNFWQNVLGAKAAYWQRHGRMKLSYGAHVGYFTNFEHSSPSIGPSIGFRILGFHGQAGYNFLLTNRNEIEANRLYLSLNYFIPRHTKLFWKKGDKEKTLMRW